MPEAAEIDARLRALAAGRGAGKTFCPSEAARALSPDDWRALMARVRERANRLCESDELCVFQGGRPVPNAVSAKGPIRLGLPR